MAWPKTLGNLPGRGSSADIRDVQYVINVGESWELVQITSGVA